MTPEQFCYWLQGFGELSAEPPTPEQWKAIKEHLSLVFRKVTPPAPGTVMPPMTVQDFQWAYQQTPTLLPTVTC